ncbi:MAG: ATP-dependent Clp protease proteolytic subunit [Alphaproteobacteria bacterium]|nr:ATP-dependent Clp protease proteolytic subunit [Alphaproteobacteria bacterium]
MTKKGNKLSPLAAAIASAATAALGIQTADATVPSPPEPLAQSQNQQNWNTVTKQALDVPHIIFPAEVTHDSANLFLMEFNQLLQKTKEGDEIFVVFPDSVGGLVDRANDIKGRVNQAINEEKRKVTYLLTGKIESASAALVLAHKGTVLATKDAKLVTHAAFFSTTDADGNFVPFKKIDSPNLTKDEKIELTATRNQFAHDIYANSCHISKELAPLFFDTEDTTIDMKTALEFGLVDDLVIKVEDDYVIDGTKRKHKKPCPETGGHILDLGPKR